LGGDINIRSTIGRILRSGWTWKVGLALVALLAIGAGAYSYYQATSSQAPASYPVLALDGHQRLLVLAPHCDDETLSAGGLLQTALARGMQIRVVVATASDGYPHATEVQFHTLSPVAEDLFVWGRFASKSRSMRSPGRSAFHSI